MTFGWEYPPGVSGREYAISGPDWERDATRWCDHCDRIRAGLLQGYGRDAWFLCDIYGEQSRAEDLCGDEDDEYGRAMDRRLLEQIEPPPGYEEFTS